MGRFFGFDFLAASKSVRPDGNSSGRGIFGIGLATGTNGLAAAMGNGKVVDDGFLLLPSDGERDDMWVA